MQAAAFPCVFPPHQRTAIESSAIKWADVDFGGRDDPRGALDAVRWHSKGDGREHFLRVQWPNGDLVTYVLRDASFARLLRDIFTDPQLDPPGKQIVLRNGTSEPFKMPHKDGKPSLGRFVSWCRLGVSSKEDPGYARVYGPKGTKDPYIIEDATWKRMSEEDIDQMIERFKSEFGGGASSLASITTSPEMPSAIASAGSPPAASASSEAGMTTQDTTPRPSPCTTPGTTQRQRAKQPSQSDSQFARSGSGERSFLALPLQAHDSSVQSFGATDGGSDPHAGNPQPTAAISSKCNGDVEAVGVVTATRKAKRAARQLPAGMTDSSAVPPAQKTAGTSAPAKAAAMVSKAAPAKRKTAKRGEDESHEANELPAKAPGKRRKAPAAPATAAEPQTDDPSALSDNNDLGLDLLDEALAATSNAVPPMPGNSPASAQPGSGPRKGLMSVTRKPVVRLAERMKATNEPSTDCQLGMHAKPSPQSDTSTGAGPLGEEAKEGLVGKDSSQSIDDSGSDSDEEPAVKFAKKLQARLLGVPCPGTVVNGSGNNRLESVTANANEHPANSHHTRSIPTDGSEKAAHCADSDDDRTLGEMLDRRQEPARSAPLMTTNKPVMLLADRRKALNGEV